MRPALAAALGLLLAAGQLAAQTPGPGRGTPPQAPAGNGEVKGTVVDLASGAPVARASVAVRAGTHCAEPLMRRFGVTSSVRASFALYNTEAEADDFVDALTKAQSFFA